MLDQIRKVTLYSQPLDVNYLHQTVRFTGSLNVAFRIFEMIEMSAQYF